MKAYTHTQSVASSTWTIVHNLGRMPASDVITPDVGVADKVYPLSVTHVDDNTMVITFVTAVTGVARLA